MDKIIAIAFLLGFAVGCPLGAAWGVMAGLGACAALSAGAAAMTLLR